MFRIHLWTSLALLASVWSCAESTKRVDVVATTGMIADLTRSIAGERLEVTALMGPDVDPHLFSPTRSDVATLQATRLVLYNGLHLEGRMGDAFEALRDSGTIVVAIGEGLPADRILLDPEQGEHPDPHVWMDASLWASATGVIADALCELDPDGAEEYRRRAGELEKELRAVHEWGREQVTRIPENCRVLITSHDAFRYFGRAYGLEVHGIQGISTDSAAGLSDITRLVDLVVERRVPAVFAESSVPSKSVEALREGAQKRGHDLHIGGELFSDAMGPEGTPAGTCVGMLEHNLRTICEALGATTRDRSSTSGGPATDQGHGKLAAMDRP